MDKSRDYFDINSKFLLWSEFLPDDNQNKYIEQMYETGPNKAQEINDIKLLKLEFRKNIKEIL
jgi:hypothetical protein